MAQRLRPLNDFIFGKTFGEKGDEEQLLSLLNAILAKTNHEKLVEIEIVEHRTFTAEVIGDKTSILDIRAVAADGMHINIEVQLKDYGNMDRRSLFYWSREFANSLHSGENYNLLPNVIAINIINFDVAKTEEFHTSFHLWEDTHRDCLLTDALEIHFIDVKKFNALPHKDLNNPLHRWLTFFDQTISDDLLKELISMDAAINRANDKMAFLAQDKETFRLYQLREMAQFDYNSGMQKAKAEGIAEGKAEGIAEGIVRGKAEGIAEGIVRGKAEGIAEGIVRGKAEGIVRGKAEGEHTKALSMAHMMVADGEPLDKIARYTGLSREEVESL